MAITKEEFEDWKAHPVTQALVKILEEKRDVLRRQWEGGAFTDYTNEGVVLTNVANIGTCRGYAFVQEIEFEDFFTE